MSGLIGDVKKLFKFKYKSRSDSFTDQYHRLFMTRALLVGCFLTGMKWYKDEIKCIIPKAFSGSVDGFGPKSCWINGFYVYKQLMNQPNIDGYYGIPNRLGHNGTYQDNYASTNGEKYTTCVASSQADTDSICQPMEKLFFLQYQWFPFYMAFVAMFYYIPYIMFSIINNDLSSLKKDIAKQKCDVDGIVKDYFNMETNQPTRQTLRVLLNILVKICYMIANVLVLTFTNSLLNDQFMNFGSRWMKWSQQENQDKYVYMGLRSPHAGQRLLPVFGMCDVLELGMDIKHNLFNEYSLVCEISQHVLYHYVLMAIWFLIIIGLVLSIVGIIHHLALHILRARFFANEEIAAQRLYNALSVREGEYLNFIRRKNVVAYGSIIRALHKQRFEIDPVTEKGEEVKDSGF